MGGRIVNPVADTRLLILYDADCGVCRFAARMLRRLDWGRRLVVAPLQSFVRSRASDPSPRQLRQSLHVRDPRGTWFRDGGAVLRVATAIPALWPLAIVARLPGTRPAVEAAYRWVADHRSAISRALRIR